MTVKTETKLKQNRKAASAENRSECLNRYKDAGGKRDRDSGGRSK